MNKGFLLLLMIFMHILDDYSLQGILANDFNYVEKDTRIVTALEYADKLLELELKTRTDENWNISTSISRVL